MDNGGHPLVDSLRRGSALGSEFGLPVREAGQEGWIKASSLFQDDDQRLRDAVVGYGRNSFGTENRHLAASGFIIAYLTRLTYPLISQYVLERRVIDVSLSNVEFHVSNGRFDGTALSQPKYAALPGDPGSGHPDAQIVRDDAALYRRLKECLYESNLDVVIPSLRSAARASVKVSWNAVERTTKRRATYDHRLQRRPQSRRS